MKHLGKENKKFTEPSVKILDKIENKLMKGPILVGYLKDKRNFTHVSDIVRAYWLATEKCKIGKLYLIGNYHKKSIFTFEQGLKKLKGLSKIIQLNIPPA